MSLECENEKKEVREYECNCGYVQLIPYETTEFTCVCGRQTLFTPGETSVVRDL